MVLILLIAATAGCLIAGVATANLLLTYVALGLAALALMLLLGDMVHRRRDSPSTTRESDDSAGADAAGDADVNEPEADDTSDEDCEHGTTAVNSETTGSNSAATDGATSGEKTSNATTSGAKVSDEIPIHAIDSLLMRNGDADSTQEAQSTSEPDLGDEVVLVVPGRKRFHRGTCRLLDTRTTEELTLNEAREEGFTPCTTCTAQALVPSR